VSGRRERIEARLREAFAPTLIRLIDESHKHVGHVGAATGLGHFALEIESHAFAQRSLLERHRLIYDALGELMRTDIHALNIVARPPR
jgi:BolA family transcriptional regulator, general stress-responsive regulator